MYDCPNELLMEQKKFVKFGLSTDNFRAYVPMIEDEVRQFMQNDAWFRIFQMNDINEWGHFDVLKVMSEITILTASRTLQGREVRSQITKDYAQVYADLDGGFTPIHWMFKNLPLESYRKRDAAHKKISDFYVEIIKKRRADPNSVRVRMSPSLCPWCLPLCRRRNTILLPRFSTRSTAAVALSRTTKSHTL